MTAVLPSGAQTIAELLRLTQRGEGQWEGSAQHAESVRLYGGLSVAQTIMAGLSDLPVGWHPSSVKATFLRAGDGSRPVTYRRDSTARGRSRYVATVRAEQGDSELIWASVAGHRPIADGIAFQGVVPTVTPPEECVEEVDRLLGPEAAGLNPVFAQRWTDVEIRRVSPTADTMPASRWWMRVTTPLQGVVANAAALAYLCDFVILDAALLPHGLSFADPRVQAASLDYSIWWHHPVAVHEWLLVETRPVVSAGARSVAGARILDRAGTQVASLIQEGRMTYDSEAQSSEGEPR